MKMILERLFSRMLVLVLLLHWLLASTMGADALVTASNYVDHAVAMGQEVDELDAASTTRRRRVEECYLHTKDFAAARTDPDAEKITDDDGNVERYRYESCDDIVYSDEKDFLYTLHDRFPKCTPVETKYRYRTYSGFDCQEDIYEANIECCVGGGTNMIVRFYAVQRDQTLTLSPACNADSSYLSANVYEVGCFKGPCLYCGSSSSQSVSGGKKELSGGAKFAIAFVVLCSIAVIVYVIYAQWKKRHRLWNRRRLRPRQMIMSSRRRSNQQTEPKLSRSMKWRHSRRHPHWPTRMMPLWVVWSGRHLPRSRPWRMMSRRRRSSNQMKPRLSRNHEVAAKEVNYTYG
jgi:hypothetical protein